MKLTNSLALSFSMLFFTLAPIFTNYVFIGQFSIGDLLVLFSLIILLDKINFNQRFFYLYFFSTALLILISYLIFTIGDFIPNSFIRASFYLMIISIYLSISFNSFEILLWFYKKICFIASVILIIQCILYYIFHYSLDLTLPLMTYEENALELMDVKNGEFRPAAIFREPSYFALYYIPLLFINQIEENWKKFIYDLFIIVLTTSSLGFIYGIVALLILYFRKISRVKILTGILLIPFMISFTLVLLNSDVILLSRTLEILKGGGSLESRLLVSIELLNQANFFTDINFAKRIFLYKSDWEWFNSIIYLLGNFGYIIILPLLLIFKKIGFRATILVIPILSVTHAVTGVYFTLLLVIFYIYSIFYRNFNLSIVPLKGK